MIVLLFLMSVFALSSSHKTPKMTDDVMYQQIQHFLEMTNDSTDASTVAVRTVVLESELYTSLVQQFGSKK
jgi:hypothetical protein